MGLFKGAGKTIKNLAKLNPIAYALRNVPRDLGRAVTQDPLKAALIIGAGALTGGAAVAAGLTAASVGTAAGIGAATGAGLAAKSQHDVHKVEMTEQRASEKEKAAEAEYNQKVAQANERAYQQNRAALLSSRRQYKRTGGVSSTQAGKSTDETDLLG